MLNYMQKTVLTLWIILSISSFVWCQTIEWENHYGGTNIEELTDILQTENNEYILVGTSYSYNDSIIDNFGNNDFWVVKIDENGQMLWQQNYGGTDFDKAASIIPATDGGYIVGGSSGSTDHDISNPLGETDYWIVKITEDGAIQWEKSLGGSFGDRLTDIIPLSDGGYLTGGYSERTNAIPGDTFGDIDILICKISSIGDIEWQRSYDRSVFDRLEKILTTPDGGYLLGGASLDNATEEHYNARLIKINSSGAIEWEKTYGGTGYDYLEDLVPATNGSAYYLGANTNSTDGDAMSESFGYEDYWLLKIDETGNIIWEKKYGHEFFDMLETVVPTSDGGALLGGTSDGGGSFINDNYWIVKVDENGDMEWQKNYEGGRFNDAIQTNDEGFLLGGTITISQEYFEVDQDFLVYKICDNSNSDCNVIDSINDDFSEQSISNIQLLPNPADDFITIQFYARQAEKVNLLFYDNNGRLLTKQEMMTKVGMNDKTLNINHYPSGTYFIKIMGKNDLYAKVIVH